jgi:hypothetical protein
VTVAYNTQALARAGLALNEGGSLVYLSSTEDNGDYSTKDDGRIAWENHTPAPSQPRHLVFPAAVHVERLAKLAKQLGY